MMSPNDCIALAAELYSLNPSRLRDRDRTRPLPQARAIAFRLMREEGMTVQRIADVFGLTHGSVLNGLANTKVWDNHPTNHQTRGDAERLRFALNVQLDSIIP